MNRFRKKSKRKGDFEQVSYWESYSDMMAGVLLVFILLLTFSMLESRLEIEKEKEQLENEQAIVQEQESELAEQQSIVQEQESEMADQQEQLAEQEQQLAEQGEQLDKIIGIKSELIKALKDEFDDSDINVYIDSNTGAVTLDSSVLFDLAKSDLKDEGKAILDTFLPVYFGVLLSDEYVDYISEIVIEGHTDPAPSYIICLQLSQARAFEVAQYCLADESNIVSEDKLDTLRKLVTANGRSFSNPLYDEDGNVKMDESRRVEFKFRLKDEEMIQEMIDVVNGVE